MSETTEAPAAETTTELPEGIVEWTDKDGYIHHGAEGSLAHQQHVQDWLSAERVYEAQQAAEAATTEASAAPATAVQAQTAAAVGDPNKSEAAASEPASVPADTKSDASADSKAPATPPAGRRATGASGS